MQLQTLKNQMLWSFDFGPNSHKYFHQINQAGIIHFFTIVLMETKSDEFGIKIINSSNIIETKN